MKTLQPLPFLFFLYSPLPEPMRMQTKAYSHLIRPVLDAKATGRKRTRKAPHAHQGGLAQGGKQVGSDILIKGNFEDSELIYRITLPKDDDEAMPPFKDEDHYNPVTAQELQVMKSWIKRCFV